MIGKQIKGKSFRGVLNYLHEKEGSRIIGGNMAGNNPRVMAAEFAVSRQLNPRLEKAVYHASLSLPHEEHLDDETWSDLCGEYLEGMEFTGSQYVVYRHSDKHHDHVHIVASRIRITDGTTVNDSWDYVRSEKLIRSLEQKYQLTPTISSEQKLQRGNSRGERELVSRTGSESIRGKLQEAIDEETEKSLAMPELISNLKNRGIDARISLTRTDKIRGISYESDGIAISGTRLGKAYTFPGLQKYKRVTYEPEMNRELKIISAKEPVALNSQQLKELEREREIERERKEYRSKYEEWKTRVQQKIDKRLSPIEIDLEISTRMIQSSFPTSEIAKTLAQSDFIYQIQREVSPDNYQEAAVDYIEKTYTQAQSLVQQLQNQTQKQRSPDLEMEL